MTGAGGTIASILPDTIPTLELLRSLAGSERKGSLIQLVMKIPEVWVEGQQSVLESETEENNDDDYNDSRGKWGRWQRRDNTMKLREKRNRDGPKSQKSQKRKFSISIIVISCHFCF